MDNSSTFFAQTSVTIVVCGVQNESDLHTYTTLNNPYKFLNGEGGNTSSLGSPCLVAKVSELLLSTDQFKKSDHLYIKILLLNVSPYFGIQYGSTVRGTF